MLTPNYFLMIRAYHCPFAAKNQYCVTQWNKYTKTSHILSDVEISHRGGR